MPNCELSDRDSRELDVHDPSNFDAANYDYYERSLGRSDGECMDGEWIMCLKLGTQLNI